VQESFAELGRLHGAAGKDRQPGSRIVTECLEELVHKARGPVRGFPDLKAVQHHRFESCRLFAVAEETPKNHVEVAIGRISAHVIDDQPIGIRARYFQCLTGPGADEPEKRPIAGRNLPREPSRAVNLARQIYRLNNSGLGPSVRDRQQGHIFKWRFEFIRSFEFIGRFEYLRYRYDIRETGRPGDVELGPGKLFARELRPYPGAPGVPAARSEEARFEAQPRGLVERVVHQVDGLVAEKCRTGRDGLLRVPDARDIPENRAAQTLRTHLLEFPCDLLAVDVSVQPCPQDHRPCRERRREEFTG